MVMPLLFGSFSCLSCLLLVFGFCAFLKAHFGYPHPPSAFLTCWVSLTFPSALVGICCALCSKVLITPNLCYRGLLVSASIGFLNASVWSCLFSPMLISQSKKARWMFLASSQVNWMLGSIPFKWFVNASISWFLMTTNVSSTIWTRIWALCLER